jgi:hypothetical protein
MDLKCVQILELGNKKVAQVINTCILLKKEKIFIGGGGGMDLRSK